MSGAHLMNRSARSSFDGIASRLAFAANVARMHQRRYPELEGVETVVRSLLSAMQGGPPSNRADCDRAYDEVRSILPNAADGDRRELSEVESVLRDIREQTAALEAATCVEVKR